MIPGQGEVALGLELLAVSLAIGVAVGRLPTTYSAGGEPSRIWVGGRWAVRVAGTAPLIIGGASVLAGSGGGLYWIVAGIAFAITGAIVNAWVLLVEILR